MMPNLLTQHKTTALHLNHITVILHKVPLKYRFHVCAYECIYTCLCAHTHIYTRICSQLSVSIDVEPMEKKG